MKTLEQIIKDAEDKARRISTEIVKARANTEVTTNKDVVIDKVLQKVINGFLGKPKSKIIAKDFNPLIKKTEPAVRLTFKKVIEVYEKTGLKPFKAEYWFYEDRKARPLIQVSTLNDERTHATPLTAYTLAKQEELLASDTPPTFIVAYRDLDKPSNTWTAGRISQISGLDISYILGFRSGYDGNAPGHPNCSPLYHLGYSDGLMIRNQMIDEKLIEPDLLDDIYADETDDGVLHELYRVRGYRREEQ